MATSLNIKLLLSTSVLLLTQTLFAKNIDLHESPSATSKVTASMNSESPIMPIFSPKNSEWIKIADPANGNVGWVKAKDVNLNGFQFHVINSNNGNASGYQVFQFGNPAQPSKDVLNAMKRMEEYSDTMRREMQNMMRNMFPVSPVQPVVNVPKPQNKTK